MAVTRVFSALSHLTLWASLYVTGAVVCFAQLVGAWEERIGWWFALAYAFCTAAAVYLLDRVKLRDAWLDPADRAAHPDRFEFLSLHAGAARGLAAAMALVSAVLGWRFGPLGPVLTIGACVGVLLYAGRPRGRRDRIKDVFLIKNGFVGAGIAFFAAFVTSLTYHRGAGFSELAELWPRDWRVWGWTGLQLLVRVVADASVCDLDDEHADRAYLTATLPTRLGRVRAWNLVAGVRILLGLVMIAFPAGPSTIWRMWGAATIASTLALRVWNPRRVREAVDGRLALEAAIVWLITRVP
jgi:hypothetical protein